MSILSFNNVSKGFGEGTNRVEVLRDINLDVREGEFLAILGFSGTGKSTLMNMIAGNKLPLVKTNAIVQQQFNIGCNQSFTVMVYGMF